MSSRLSRVRGLLASGLVLALLGCSTGDGETAALPPVGTEEGSLAPPLRGLLPTGEAVRLEDIRSSGPTVLVFYRGGRCGLCRERLRGLGEHLETYRELGATVVAVTPDPPERTAQTLAELGVEIPVVSVDTATLIRWGVLAAPEEPPLPATYLLDRRGVIRFRHLGRNAADRVGDASLIALLKQRETASS